MVHRGQVGSVQRSELSADRASSEVELIDLNDDDWVRVIELIGIYSDLGLGTVDASIVAVAERRGLSTITTLNHRFRAVRPSHIAAFELVP